MKKILSAVLAAALLFSLSLTASAAEGSTGSMDNFRPSADYSGQFTDVAPSDWEYSDVSTCYEYNLMQGMTSSSFQPDGNLSVAQAIVMADRIHEIYYTGQSTIENGSPWYQPYVDYAVENGILEAGAFSDYNAPVTRAEMALLLYNALPVSEFTEINTIDDISFGSFGESAGYETVDKILQLYRAGIVTGNDIYGAFYPENSITRAESSAILARTAVPKQRRHITLVRDGYSSDLLPHVDLILPHGMETISDDSLTTFIGDAALAVVSSEYDAELEGINITEISPDDYAQALQEGFSDSGSALTGISSESVSFATMQVYRTTGTYTSPDFTMDCVIYAWISQDGHMNIIALLSDDDTVLKAMANDLRIYGTSVTQKL